MACRSSTKVIPRSWAMASVVATARKMHQRPPRSDAVSEASPRDRAYPPTRTRTTKMLLQKATHIAAANNTCELATSNQRSLTVKTKDAEAKAKRAFERLEEVPDWKCRRHPAGRRSIVRQGRRAPNKTFHAERLD